MKPEQEATFQPAITSIIGKVILENKSDMDVTLELFNKKHGCNIYTENTEVDVFFMSKYISCKVIMIEKFIESETPYREQSYRDFMESLIEQGGLIIDKFDSTDNSQVEIYMKDLIKGRIEYKSYKGLIPLLGRTPVIVKLFANQKFEMSFTVNSKQFKTNDNTFTSI